jgi:hypothetical protein
VIRIWIIDVRRRSLFVNLRHPTFDRKHVDSQHR